MQRQLNLQKSIVINGFFDAYRQICKIGATDGTENDKLKTLRNCMKAVEKCDDTNLSSTLATLEKLYDELMVEITSHKTITASVWDRVKGATYKEKNLDRMIKTIAAARAIMARPIFTQLNEIKEVKEDDQTPVALFQKMRTADYKKIGEHEAHIRRLKAESLAKTGVADSNEIRAIDRKIEQVDKERKALVDKYVKYNDPEAVALAHELGYLVPFRPFDGLSSQYGPSYFLLNADVYFFKTIIQVDLELQLGEITLKDFENNMISNARSKPIIPNPSSTADLSEAEQSKQKEAEALAKKVAEQEQKEKAAKEENERLQKAEQAALKEKAEQLAKEVQLKKEIEERIRQEQSASSQNNKANASNPDQPDNANGTPKSSTSSTAKLMNTPIAAQTTLTGERKDQPLGDKKAAAKPEQPKKTASGKSKNAANRPAPLRVLDQPSVREQPIRESDEHRSNSPSQ